MADPLMTKADFSGLLYNTSAGCAQIAAVAEYARALAEIERLAKELRRANDDYRDAKGREQTHRSREGQLRSERGQLVIDLRELRMAVRAAMACTCGEPDCPDVARVRGLLEGSSTGLSPTPLRQREGRRPVKLPGCPCDKDDRAEACPYHGRDVWRFRLPGGTAHVRAASEADARAILRRHSYPGAPVDAWQALP